MKILDQNNAARMLDARQDERTRRARQDPDAKKFEDLLRGKEGDEEMALQERPEGEDELLEMEEPLPEVLPVPEDVSLEEAPRVEAQAEVEGAAASDPAIDQIVDKMVEAVHVGQDEKARRVVLMDVVVPGMGRLRVRLKRTRQGVEVRLRAEAPELTKLLRSHKSELMESARGRGIEMTRVEVADRGASSTGLPR